jgi:hypothetical protein
MTDPTHEDAGSSDDLLLQVRTAHRLLAAYYQRLLPTINDIASSLGLTFYGWMPSEHDRTPQFSKNIFDSWQWDLLPANCTRYTFFDAPDKNKICVGNYMVEFHVISDTGIQKINFPKGNRSQPDALNLPTSVEQADSLLRIHLYAPYQSRDANWHDGLFNNCADPCLKDESKPQKIADGINSFINGFEIPLSELMKENTIEDLKERIASMRDKLIGVAIKENNTLIR